MKPSSLSHHIKRAIKPFAKSTFAILTKLFVRPIPPSKLLIIRTDAIGDYLLFRPFLSSIRETYPNYHITLLGNASYRDLALCFDRESIDTFLWFKPKSFSRNIMYRICFLYKLKKMRFTLCLNPMYSRDIATSILISYVNAPNKIAPLGDCVNSTPAQKTYFDRFYTQLTPCAPQAMFEFYRNMEFFTHAINLQTQPSPYINASTLPSLSSCFVDSAPLHAKSYSVLFIGASAAYRKWSIEHFAKIGSYLATHYHQHIIICGGIEDRANASHLQSLITNNTQSHNTKPQILNLAGKTSLTALGSLVYNGNYLISNETGCAHLGTLLDTTIVIVVYNGNHLGRFIPYPKRLSDKYYPVFHRFIEDNFDKYEQLSNAFAYKSNLDINEIKPESIISIIDSTSQFLHKEQI